MKRGIFLRKATPFYPNRKKPNNLVLNKSRRIKTIFNTATKMLRENHTKLLSSSTIIGLALMILSLSIFSFISYKTISTIEANPDGDLRINVITAPNFIVDSNVESPSTYAPNAVYVGAQFCNDGTDTLTQVLAYIGDFDANTPGIYPARTHTGLTGTFSLTHEGGSAGEQEATRYLPRILPGECINQFWLVSYPTLDDNGNAVTQGIKPEDDLWLEYDVWATANDNGTSLTANQDQTVYMRNEISAMANKIWPNGDNKVPSEYLAAIEESLGWSIEATSGGSEAYPGEAFTLQGVWYDLGNVGHGFDSDGDFIPDRDVWMQPVGDAAAYNPDCFRLLGAHGLVIVKKTDGTELLIPFNDELYFKDLPEKNTGAVGLVFYSFAALDGPCSGNLTPYQEVASGFDNEKFNGDFGRYIPLAISKENAVTMNKTVDKGVLSNVLPDTLTFTLSVNNTGTVPLGTPYLGLPVVMEDSIPNGTVYIAGSAAIDNILPTGVSNYTILYSADSGNSWTTTEPAAASVTTIRWLLDDALPAGSTGSVNFKTAVEIGNTEAVICNTGTASFGFTKPFEEDSACTLAPGNNSLGDNVWEDDGGTTGTIADGIKNGDEAGILDIEVTLYYDSNGNGIVDSDDLLWGKDTTDINGNYLFADLPDGNYIVQICDTCITTGAYAGWGATTPKEYIVPIDIDFSDPNPLDTLTIDFGFSPALKLDKTLSSAMPVYEGQELTFDLKVENLLPASSTSSSGSSTVPDALWSNGFWDSGISAWTGHAAVVGCPDGLVATATNPWESSGGTNSGVYGTGITAVPCGNITKVEVVFAGEMDGLIVDDDIRVIILDGSNNQLFFETYTTANAPLNNWAASGGGTVTIDITAATGITNWASWDGSLKFGIQPRRDGGSTTTWDGNTLTMDAIGIQITTDGSGCDLVDDCGGGGSSSGPCTYDLFINEDQNLNFLPTANLLGEYDDNFAMGNVWGRIVEGGNFINPGATGNITKVEMFFKFYYTGPLSDDEFFARVVDGGSTVGGNIQVPNADLISLNGIENAGEVVIDVTTVRTWSWSDFNTTYGSGIDLYLQGSTLNGGDGALPYIDGVGYRITTDETCTSGATSSNFDPATSLQPVPLCDDYHPDSLEFVSASMIPDSIDTVNGKIYWDNIGPINASESVTVSVTFKAKEPFNNITGSTTNTAIVSNAKFGSGDDANTDTSSAQITIEPTGTISGYVWSDGDADGWQGTTGYETGEDFVPNVTIVLHTCNETPGNNGSCGDESTDTIYTDETGYYLFEGLLPNLHYSVEIVETSLPGTVSETGDPDDDPNRGSGNGGTCGSGGANALCDALWNNDKDWFEIGVDTWGTEMWDPNNINFGYTINPTIYGNVWEDINGDGIQETGEIGIAGVTVELQHAGCTAGVDCPTTTTDAAGNYEFVDLTAGTAYTIVVGESTLPPVGTWTETAETDATINNSILVSPTSGEISGSHNFGYTATGTAAIGDTLFYDLNGDGMQATNEESIPGVILSLYKDVDGNGLYDPAIDFFMDTTMTDANGQYLFINLPAGDYIVVVEEGETGFPANVSQTADPDEPNTYCSTCDATGAGTLTTDTLSTIDFGYQPYGTATIGDLVWYDANGDGMQVGATETGFADVSIQLWVDFNNDGTYVLWQTETTDLDGNYLFENLPDANYQVIVDSTDSDMPLDVFGNTYNPSTITTYDVVVSNNEVSSIDGTTCTDCELNMDFGFVRLGSIGDMVFWDANVNGEQDWSEEGIANITVYLLDGMGVKIDSTTTSDGTDGNAVGYYNFSGLAPNEYTVLVDIADPDLNGGILITDPSADGIPCTDPTAFECDNQYTTTIGYGTNFAGGDFGYQPSGVIGDYIWFDQNGDGIQDGGEIGIGDVRVILTNQTDVTIDGVFYTAGTYKDTTYTDLDGGYIYQNMPDGTYTVEVETPVSMAITSGAESVGTTSTTVVMSGGNVTAIGGAACTDCDLNTDFGFELSGPYSLSGSICLDDDLAQDGVCGGAGDSQLEGITVYLYNDAGAYLGSTLTDASGNYSFGNLPADTYIVAIGTTDSPLDISDLTTTAANTPATSITEGAISTYQTVPLSSNITVVDFAFELVVDLDFGDLPDVYKTSLSIDGARHIIPLTPTLFLGTTVDIESNGNPSTLANGDGSDEDGVLFLDPITWTTGIDGGSIQVTVQGNGYLVGWIDFGQDNSLVSDMIVDTALTTGQHTLSFDIPTGTTLLNETFYARFRYFPTEPAFPEFAYVGMADDGEVEDYQFKVAPMNYDYGDLPDIAMGTTGINDYETYDFTGGPSHLIIAGLFLGDTVDIDTDGMPNSLAMGDDTSNVADEDGLMILASLNISPGRPFRLPLSVTNTTGDTAYIKAWIDWNGDGDFADTDEAVINIKDSTNNVFPTYLEITPPNNALVGSLLGFRVRLSNEANLTPYGSATSGEVEDYLLGVECQQVCLPIGVEVKRF